MSFSFDNTYAKLPDRFFEEATPETSSSPQLIAWNRSLSDQLGLSLEKLSESELTEVFSGNRIPDGAKPIAMAYSGHQFGHFSPKLGDGRALLLGEVLDGDGLRHDVQLKGAGQTPFSRRGDGKSALGPVLREYLVSEAMFHLGVPTTRALAAVTTGDSVQREETLPGGVFTRVATSHLRVGTFEFFASREDTEGVGHLLNYAIDRHYPEIRSAETKDNNTDNQNLALAFLKKVIEGQAALVAHWMDLGFIHGVMNTDNCSVGCITIDYGPCAFMDHFQADKVFSSIDQDGRYAYNNQPAIAQWNLARLAECLLPLFPGDEKEAIAAAEKELIEFKALHESLWQKRMSAKLGIDNYHESDIELIGAWLEYLEKESLDYTLAFRNLPSLLDGDPHAMFPITDSFKEFELKWMARVAKQGLPFDEVKAGMNQRNPAYIPRNHQIERAIQAGVGGDFSVFKELHELLKKPYEEQPGFEKYAAAPEDDEKVCATFCGT